MNKMIDISGLTKEYSGNKVVSGIDLQVDHGELFGFLGPNDAW
jgi:ABC-type multidrug transport system ATPase subunit